MVLSPMLHGAAVAAVIGLAGVTAGVMTPPPSTTLTFLYTPPPPVRVAVRLTPPPPEVMRMIEAPRVEIVPPPVPEIVEARVEPAPPAPEPRREEPAPAAPARRAPVVSLGAFDPATATARASEASRALQPAGFDSVSARAPEITTATTAVGAFERPTGRPQPGVDRSAVASDAGFGSGVAAAPARGSRGVVGDAGFSGGTATGTGRASGRGVVATGGLDSVASGARGAQPAQTVRATEFDTRATQAAARPAAQARTEVPLEIFSKPTPVYTAEARALKIEGEVLLEIEFAATGELRVLRVVRGLGHGLDESATRAVQGIRFKPALRGGEPIDVRMTVNIVFRLA